MSHPSSGLWQNRQIVGFSMLAMASSGFGQTFFVAVFGAEIRGAFELSHTAYGTLYSLATICAAALLLRAGRWVDHWPLARVTAVAVALLALGCLLLGLAAHVAVLALAFLLIRFGGQGLIAHVAVTVAARSFSVNRGKAVALAAAGIPAAEACLPIAAVFVVGFGGWRAPWLAGTAILLLLVLPVLWRLAGRVPLPRAPAGTTPGDAAERAFTRAEALRDPGLYMLLPAVLASPFVVTAVLFHQAALAEARNWSLELVATAFTGFAAGHLLMLFVTGPLVDRIGAHRSLPLALIPMTLGLAVLAAGSGLWAAFVYLGLTGMTLGGVATANGALWAERYGTRHLGSIRAVAQAAMVVSTAAAPLLLGFVLDLGWTVTVVGAILSLGTALAALLALIVPVPIRPGTAGPVGEPR